MRLIQFAFNIEVRSTITPKQRRVVIPVNRPARYDSENYRHREVLEVTDLALSDELPATSILATARQSS